MRLRHLDLPAGQFLIILLEDLIVGSIEFAGWIIRHIRQFDHFPLTACCLRIISGVSCAGTAACGTACRGPAGGGSAAACKRPGCHQHCQKDSRGSFKNTVFRLSCSGPAVFL